MIKKVIEYGEIYQQWVKQMSGAAARTGNFKNNRNNKQQKGGYLGLHETHATSNVQKEIRNNDAYIDSGMHRTGDNVS